MGGRKCIQGEESIPGLVGWEALLCRVRILRFFLHSMQADTFIHCARDQLKLLPSLRTWQLPYDYFFWVADFTITWPYAVTSATRVQTSLCHFGSV